MEESELTSWFPGTVKPARPGVYQTRESDGTKFYNEWDGRRWHWGIGHSPAKATNQGVMPADRQRLLVTSWRGLAASQESKS